jgi:tRNA threonylcarbamoyladenosine modification (KEOPS) complex Cgi121 subunit
VVAEPGSAHWVQVDERSGAAGVEAAAISAVKQLQASGVNVAKDLQVRTLLRLCSAAMLLSLQ